MVLTLIPKFVAERDYEFIHLGGIEICENCSLKTVCINSIKVHHSYKVIEVRKKEHKCPIDDSVMLVCDVQETKTIISVLNQKFLEGIVLSRKKLECNETLCEYYENCLHPLFNEETKVKVMKIIKKIDCPLNYNLMLVEVNKEEK